MARWIGAVLAVGVATGASAQQRCEHAPLIAQMAAHVLEERSDLPRLMQARFGDLAAFYAIQYGDGDAARTLAALQSPDVRAPRLLDDLLGAFELSQPDGLAAWQNGDAETLQRFLGMMQSTRRALLLADDGVTYLDLLAQVQADEDLLRQLRTSDPFGAQVAFAVADQPDEWRRALADLAEQQGQLWVAAAVLGDLEDRTAFYELLARTTDVEDFVAFEPEVQLGYFTIGTLAGETPLRGPREGNLEATLQDQHFYLIMRASLMGQPSDYLGIFHNQTGLTELSSFAGQVLIKAVEAGEIDPVSDPEAAWLLLYRTLLSTGGPLGVQQTLATFNWPPQTARSYAGFAIESLDVMTLKDAFGPYVRAETQEFPIPDDSFAQTQQWSEWAAVAQVVRAGVAVQSPVDQPWIAVELSWEAGEFGAAFDIARGQMETADALTFMRDGMQRLDALCGPTIGLPGDAVRYGGLPVFRFD